MVDNLYDTKNPKSIYEYSKGLIGKSFDDIYKEDIYVKESNQTQDDYGNRRRKGGLGELVEERYFKYESNNDSGPDFKEAGLELKVTPYKINKNKTISSKERMVITMINYYNIVEEEFFNSSLWVKSRLILMVFYLWEKEAQDRLDYKIDYVHLYSPEKEDLKIIKEDFYKIKSKVLQGKAHELSEGDTMYLGAATKASSSKDRTGQPYSKIEAKPRAFSFKNSYMTYILNTYVTKDKNKEEKILKDKKDLSADDFLLSKKDTFEEYVLNKINNNIGIQDTELFKKYYEINSEKDLKKIERSKGKYSNLAFRMLGVKSNKAEEFEKANIVVKTIRLSEDEKIRESLSFPTFKIKDLVNQVWEESAIYNYFSQTKFLFMVFKKNELGRYFFKEAKFWNMSNSTINNELRVDWEVYINKFKEGVTLTPTTLKNGKVIVKNDLPAKGDTNLLHVRPHARLAAHLISGKKYGRGKLERDSDELLNGDRMTKQCFWLSNNYLEKIVGNSCSLSPNDIK